MSNLSEMYRETYVRLEADLDHVDEAVRLSAQEHIAIVRSEVYEFLLDGALNEDQKRFIFGESPHPERTRVVFNGINHNKR